MNFKVENPDYMDGLGDLLPAEILNKLNELLEQLHKAGHTNQGSNNTFIYVARGAHYVKTQINIGAHPNPPQGREKGTERSALPDVLSTEEAMALWKKMQDAGYVDVNYQPLISRTQAAILAYEMAKRLDIKDKWKLFEAFWCRRNMYRDYYDALNQSQSIKFRDKLKAILR